MDESTYGYTTQIKGKTFDEALRHTTEALKGQGFGVLTEIDVKTIMKKKLDVDFRKYTILGACNPPLAHKALSSDLFIGLLLPCNVIVYEDDEESITVSAVKPEEMFKVVDRPGLESLAAEVGARLQSVMSSLSELSSASL